jgi:polyhydroxyalkanoate synthesis regulator phasin
MYEEVAEKLEEFWREKLQTAKAEIYRLRKKVGILEQEIEREKGKTYLEDLLTSDREENYFKKVCRVCCLLVL